jgi:hypothetical protein
MHASWCVYRSRAYQQLPGDGRVVIEHTSARVSTSSGPKRVGRSGLGGQEPEHRGRTDARCVASAPDGAPTRVGARRAQAACSPRLVRCVRKTGWGRQNGGRALLPPLGMRAEERGSG